MRRVISYTFIGMGVAIMLLVGMMVTRRNDATPSPFMLLRYREPNSPNCQLVRLLPATGIQQNFAAGQGLCQSVIIKAHEWLYYSVIEFSSNGTSGTSLLRIDLRLNRRERVIENLARGTVFITPDGRTLIYEQRLDDGTSEFFSANLDGSDPHSLTAIFGSQITDIDRVWLPQVMPNGKEVAFMAFSPNADVLLCRVALDGSQGQIVARMGEGYWAASTIRWTTDNQWMVIRTIDGTHAAKVRPDSGEIYLLSAPTDPENWAAYSAEGDVIIFSTFGPPQKLMGVDVATGRTLWELGDIQYAAVYPQGDWIGFLLMDGRIGRRIVAEDRWEWYGTLGQGNAAQALEFMWDWTPDGEWVWFIRFAGTTYRHDLVRMRRDTGETQVIIHDANPYYEFVSWSPDGEWVIYRDANTNALYQMRTDGSHAARLTPDDGYYGFETWLPLAKNEAQWSALAGAGILMLTGGALGLFRVKRERHPDH